MQNKDFIIKQIAYGTRQMATGKWRWWFQPQNFLSESPFMRPATADPPWPFLAKRLQQPNVTCPTNAMYISIHSSKKLHFTNLFSSQISEPPATKQRGTKKSLLWEGSKPSSKNAVFFFFWKIPGILEFFDSPGSLQGKGCWRASRHHRCGLRQWQNQLGWFGAKGSLWK